MKESTNRLHSVDILCGIIIAGMILVNNPGDWNHTWPFLKHAAWDGLIIADLVFPFFLVVVGVSVVLSIDNQTRKGISNNTIIKKVLVRTLKIAVLGLLLHLLWDHNPDSFRIPGVLQRIAVVYLVCSVLYLYAKSIAWSAFFLFSTLLAFLALVWMPKTGDLSWYAWVDSLLFSKHVYSPTALMAAEGAISGITAIQSGIFGLWTGVFLQNKKYNGVLLMGALAISLGILMHLTLQPMNKLLWTPSFAWVTGGMACLLLYILVQMEQYFGRLWLLEPFRRVGNNPIAIYAGFEVLEHIWLGHWFSSCVPGKLVISFLQTSSPFLFLNSLIWSLPLVGFFLLIGWNLYAKRIFVKL